jgi:hypothetical protein
MKKKYDQANWLYKSSYGEKILKLSVIMFYNIYKRFVVRNKNKHTFI